MKKIIAIAVVFALLVGSAFAADVSGTVHGTTKLLDVTTAKTYDKAEDEDVKADIGAGGGMSRVRAELYGGSDDEKWGGWVRIEGGMQGNAWWKPIDQLLVRFGQNSDGIWGKEGNTGWMFMQTPTDTGVTFEGENVWGWSVSGGEGGFGQGIRTRHAFFDGYGDNRLALEINPIDVLGINLALPMGEGIAKDFYKCVIAQVNLNFAFGNIAITYKGGKGYSFEEGAPAAAGSGPTATDKDGNPIAAGTWFFHPVTGQPTYGNQADPDNAAGNKYSPGSAAGKPGDPTEVEDPGTLFLYFGGNFGPIAIDFGFSFAFPYTKDNDAKVMPPLGLGLGFKFYNDGVFGIKARFATTLAGKVTPDQGDATKTPVKLLFDILPYFVFSDNFSLFIAGGIVMTGKLKENYADGKRAYQATGDTADENNKALLAWHVNPYVVIGSEWGPKFMAGIKLWQTHAKDESKDPKKFINFSIPVAIQVGF